MIGNFCVVSLFIKPYTNVFKNMEYKQLGARNTLHKTYESGTC